MKRFTKKIDHLGLVAGMCDEVGITKIVDAQIPPDQRAELSVGKCLKLMIVNAMGFFARPLYLEAEFFSKQAFNRLLGKALDQLYKGGCERLFSTITCSAFKHFHINSAFRHLDTTSISVHGDDEEGMGLIEFGYSKDGQPGLKQFMISLMTSQDGDVPLLAKTLAGNASDKAHFSETLQKVKEGIFAKRSIRSALVGLHAKGMSTCVMALFVSQKKRPTGVSF